MSKSAVVVFDSSELSEAEVIAKAKITPLLEFGKNDKSFFAMILCNPIFSTAIASKNPPKNKNIIDFE